MIAEPEFDKTFNAVNFAGLPYFFGVSCFAFEGSGLTIDIYNSLQHKRRDWNKALTLGLTVATALLMSTGIIMYHAFAQFSHPEFLASLPSTEGTTYIIKVLYGVGVTAGYTLQVAPLLNLFDRALHLGEDVVTNANGEIPEKN